jgi:hypothetical protein
MDIYINNAVYMGRKGGIPPDEASSISILRFPYPVIKLYF